AQHLAALARFLHEAIPGLVDRGKLGEELLLRDIAQRLGHERLDRHVGELARVAEQATEDESLARYVEPAEVVAWIGLGVAQLHGSAHGIADRTPARHLADTISP